MLIETKEAKALDQIGQTIAQLETTIQKLEGRPYRIREWYEQRIAFHEIKEILSEILDYIKLNPERYAAFIADYNHYLHSVK